MKRNKTLDVSFTEKDNERGSNGNAVNKHSKFNTSNDSKALPNQEPNKCISVPDKIVQHHGLEESVERQHSPNLQPKMNAFQLMMDSRYKVIGANYSGKDLPVEENLSQDKEKNEKLATRKKIFSKWADKKGASKRKRDEEEKDEIIKHKMNQRSKRLKKLLDVSEDGEYVELKDDTTKKKKRRRVKRHSCISDNEPSQEPQEFKENGSCTKANSSFEEFFCKDDIKKQKDNNKLNTPKNDLTAIKTDKHKSVPNGKLPLLDEHVENSVSPTKKNGEHNSLLNFFQAIDKSKKSIGNESEQEPSGQQCSTKTVQEHPTKAPINNGKSLKSESKKKKSKKQRCEPVEELNIQRKSKRRTKPKIYKEKDVMTDESSQESFSPTIRTWKTKIQTKMNREAINESTKDIIVTSEINELISDSDKNKSEDVSSKLSIFFIIIGVPLFCNKDTTGNVLKF